ncbi:MAG: hypothetical protein K6G12_07700 [Lachnospiraceae bacterium]|nr:hypothetical protein [Lachnospiraceae bacterium]
MAMILCQGCAKTAVPEAQDLTADSKGNTGTGITIGSTYAEFAEVYGKYSVQKIDGENFEPYAFEDIEELKKAAGSETGSSENAAGSEAGSSETAAGSETGSSETAAGSETGSSETATEGDLTPSPHDGAYFVAAFYVDDEPTSVEELCSSTGKDASELADYLSSNEYLAEHTVIYRYVIFTVENDVITAIKSDYLDYNEEL